MTIFFAFFGIAIIAVAIGILGGWVARMQEEALAKASAKASASLEKTFNEMDGGEIAKEEGDKEEEKEKEDGPPPPFALVLFKKIGPAIAIVLVCALVMGLVEEWSAIDAVYWAIITATTVGYGDVSPHTSGGRWLACVMIPILVVGLSRALSAITEAVLETEMELSGQALLKKEITLQDLLEMDDGDGKVTEYEFNVYMLTRMGKVEQKDFDMIKRQFDKMDADGNGYLDEQDLRILKEKADKALHKKQLALGLPTTTTGGGGGAQVMLSPNAEAAFKSAGFKERKEEEETKEESEEKEFTSEDEEEKKTGDMKTKLKVENSSSNVELQQKQKPTTTTAEKKKGTPPATATPPQAKPKQQAQEKKQEKKEQRSMSSDESEEEDKVKKNHGVCIL